MLVAEAGEVGLLLLLSYFVIKAVRGDQFSYKLKKHDTIQETNQKGKSFEDIGGCEKAKEAIK